MKTRLLSSMLGTALVLGATGCPNQARNDSITATNEGNKAAGDKRYEDAVVAYKRATDLSHDNHTAWYGLGGAQLKRNDFVEAANAFDTAAQLVPDEPLYQMWDGVAQFRKTVAQLTDEQAKKAGKKPEEITVDLSAAHFDKAQTHLEEALKLSPDLATAHYYLGQIYRAEDKPKETAEQFTLAIRANPRDWAPYVGLAELYQRWDKNAEAVQVAQQGVANVPGGPELGDVYYELGMGYDADHQDDKSIEAFTKALELKRDNHMAVFERGQAEFHKGDFNAAKKDLEDYGKTGGSGGGELNKSKSAKMLGDIMVKQAPPAPTPTTPAKK